MRRDLFLAVACQILLEDVKASFDNGELKIVVPKEAPKQIEENKFIPIE